MLPKAAAIYLKQIEEALTDKEERAVIKGRHILRQMIGPITLSPDIEGALWASYGVDHSLSCEG